MLLYIELSNKVHKIAGRGAGNACSCTCYKNLIYHNTTQRVAICYLLILLTDRVHFDDNTSYLSQMVNVGLCHISHCGIVTSAAIMDLFLSIKHMSTFYFCLKMY